MLQRLSILAVALMAGCSVGQTNQPIQPTTRDNSVTTNFPYELTSEQKAKFIETVKNLRVGDSYDNVTQQLGQPWSESVIQGKEADAPVKGISVNYYLRKQYRDRPNEREDRYVNIGFDNNRRLTDILTNIEGLSTNLAMQGQWKIWRLPDTTPPRSEPDHKN